MREEDAHFADALRSGHFAFGTLETFLIWRWSAGRRHETDVTVAARTLMLDLEAGDWSPRRIAGFGVPAGVLPAVARRCPTTSGPRAREIPLRANCWLGEAGSLLRGYLNGGWVLEPSGPVEQLGVGEGELDLVGYQNVIGSRLHLNFAGQPCYLRRFFQPLPSEMAFVQP